MNNRAMLFVLITQFACSLSGTSLVAQSVQAPRITSVYTRAEMMELLREWRSADGDAVFVVSDRLAFFLTGNPPDFYDEMAAHPDQLDHWLSRLGGTTFTDFGRSCVDRRCLRQQMIRAVESTRGPTKEAEAARLRILVTLQKTDVRTVD
ncbi:MAG TPA: hypothetical protein VLC46_18800 [Thermoanaerobaculia bacterium]|jgi:hypothetical protein|nr:hypothetical protein [Thermoanaerobaculia bacterium]